MKNYQRVYISHMQDDWVDHLLMAEFVANHHVNVSTRVNLFFANNKFYLHISIEPI